MVKGSTSTTHAHILLYVLSSIDTKLNEPNSKFADKANSKKQQDHFLDKLCHTSRIDYPTLGTGLKYHNPYDVPYLRGLLHESIVRESDWARANANATEEECVSELFRQGPSLLDPAYVSRLDAAAEAKGPRPLKSEIPKFKATPSPEKSSDSEQRRGSSEVRDAREGDGEGAKAKTRQTTDRPMVNTRRLRSRSRSYSAAIQNSGQNTRHVQPPHIGTLAEESIVVKEEHDNGETIAVADTRHDVPEDDDRLTNPAAKDKGKEKVTIQPAGKSKAKRKASDEVAGAEEPRADHPSSKKQKQTAERDAPPANSHLPQDPTENAVAQDDHQDAVASAAQAPVLTQSLPPAPDVFIEQDMTNNDTANPAQQPTPPSNTENDVLTMNLSNVIPYIHRNITQATTTFFRNHTDPKAICQLPPYAPPALADLYINTLCNIGDKDWKPKAIDLQAKDLLLAKSFFKALIWAFLRNNIFSHEDVSWEAPHKIINDDLSPHFQAALGYDDVQFKTLLGTASLNQMSDADFFNSTVKPKADDLTSNFMIALTAHRQQMDSTLLVRNWTADLRGELQNICEDALLFHGRMKIKINCGCGELSLESFADFPNDQRFMDPDEDSESDGAEVAFTTMPALIRDCGDGDGVVVSKALVILVPQEEGEKEKRQKAVGGELESGGLESGGPSNHTHHDKPAASKDTSKAAPGNKQNSKSSQAQDKPSGSTFASTALSTPVFQTVQSFGTQNKPDIPAFGHPSLMGNTHGLKRSLIDVEKEAHKRQRTSSGFEQHRKPSVFFKKPSSRNSHSGLLMSKDDEASVRLMSAASSQKDHLGSVAAEGKTGRGGRPQSSIASKVSDLNQRLLETVQRLGQETEEEVVSTQKEHIASAQKTYSVEVQKDHLVNSQEKQAADVQSDAPPEVWQAQIKDNHESAKSRKVPAAKTASHLPADQVYDGLDSDEEVGKDFEGFEEDVDGGVEEVDEMEGVEGTPEASDSDEEDA